MPKLIAAALIAKEPARYGFDVTLAEPAAYDSIIVPGMTGLDVIARLADTTVAAVREMNPQYLRLATPPGVPSIVRIPPGSRTGHRCRVRRASGLQAGHLRGAPRGEGRDDGRHRTGTTSAFGCSPTPTPGFAGRSLRPGQQVIVPTGGALSTSVARRVADPVVPASSTATGFHRVRRGETLSGLADEYDVTVAQLRAWNALGRSGNIRAGQRLRVAPAGAGSRRPQLGDIEISPPAPQQPGARGEAGGNAWGPGETIRRLGPGPQGSESDYRSAPPSGPAPRSGFPASASRAQ